MSDVIITPNRGVATEGKIEFYSGSTPALSGTISVNSGNITIVPEGAGTVQVGKVGNTTTIPGDLTVTGNLTINGTTTTVNSTTITVDDPIFTIGGDTAPASDDNKDRGIAFRWHNGSAAKLGFFGYDDSTGKFTFIADATDTSDVFSGTTGEIDAKLDWSNVLNKPTIGSGTVTSVSFTGGIISVATGTTTPAFTVAGTSGGIPYFSSTSTWASSAALAANAIVVGGGAGNAPATITTGTGVVTALGVNVGGAGAFVTNGGALGTPSSGTLTNCSGLPISGIASLGSNVGTFLATPSSANLAAAVTDETGSGALVFGTNPTLGLPRFSSNVSVSAAGTTQGAATALTSDFNVVTSVTQGSAQGVRLPAGVAGIKVVVRNAAAATVNVYPESGAALDGFAVNSPKGIIAGGIMEFIAVSATQWYTYGSLMDLGTIKDPSFQIGSNVPFDFSTTVTTTKRSYKFPDSDADILTSVTTKTGSGNLVYATSPSLVTPSLGAATATTINGLTVSTSTGTLTVANGKTLTASNTLTFTGTDASSVAFGAGGTVVYTSNKLSVHAATTSAELAGVISDETGSGALVFGTSPSLTTPALSGETFSTSAAITAGTNAQGQGALTSDYNVITTAANPSGVTLPTATTGRRIVIVNRGANPINVYPATGGYIDGLAINTAIAIPVNGVMYFNASSTTQWYSSANSSFSAPSLGAATATSINGLTITSSTGTLTVTNAKTLSVSNTLTFTGTDSSSVAFGAGGTVAYTSNNLGAFAATTSAQLAGVISDETGSGALVFATSPSLTTPTLGVASATSINKVAITAPATSATLTIADGKTLTASNTLTFTGTDSSSVAFGTGGTVVYTSNKLSVHAATTSAELAGVISDETGSGALVFGTSPTFTTSLVAGSATMALLDATATTINFGRAATNITMGATNGTVTCQYNLVVSNKLEATTKSFVIDHPTKWKEGMKLRYACLEGPENGVYVRGSLTDEDTIELPEYWMNLVDENSITVSLTPIGSSNGHYVKSIKNNVVTVGSRSGNINCHYIVYGERKDVSKLVVEYHAA